MFQALCQALKKKKKAKNELELGTILTEAQKTRQKFISLSGKNPDVKVHGWGGAP